MVIKNKKLKVIFITGSGRSGTTLLERLIGQHSKIFAAGELNFIWQNSFIENQLCGCGKPFYSCETWQQIISFFRKKQNITDNLEHIKNLEKKYSNTSLFLLKSFFNLNKPTKEIKELVQSYENLYESIVESQNVEAIIDSSKNIPHFFYLINFSQKIDPYILHIVRNPMAVAYSWKKQKLKPDTGKKEPMPKYSTINTSFRWLIKNYASQKYFKNYKYKRIIYEDLVKDPKNTLKNIFQFVNLNDEADIIFKEKNTVNLKVNHTVSGNPMRFKTGTIEIKEDNEWKVKMKSKDKKLVELLTFPLLKRFYP